MQFKCSQSANIFFDGVKFYLTNSLTEIIYSIPVMETSPGSNLNSWLLTISMAYFLQGNNMSGHS